MKLYKKNLNSLCILTWKDAKGQMGATLATFLKEGFIINKTVGWLEHFDKEKVVLSTEKSENSDTMDLVMIPYDWIINIEWIEE